MTKKTKKTAAIAGCVLLVGALFAGAVSGSEEPVEEGEVEKTIVVDTQNPTTMNLSVTGEFIGTVEPGRQVTVYPKLGGEVQAVHFNVGDVVTAGDVLMEVDTTSLQYTIAQTQAALAKAEAGAQLSIEMAEQDLEIYYESLELGTNSSLIQAESSILTIEAQLAQAEGQLSSYNNSLATARRTYRDMVADKNSIDYSDDDIQKARDGVVSAELAVESAQNSVEVLRAALETAQAGAYATEYAVGNAETSYEYALRGAQISGNYSDQHVALQQLQQNLSDATLRAPISGVIEQRNFDPFDMAAQSTPAFVISDKDSMSISFKVSEAAYAHMNIGDALQIEKNGTMSAGRVYEISTMVDASGLFTVKATVDNPPADLFTGAAVKVHAQAQKADNALTVPLDCLYYENGVPYVYLYENGIAVRRNVEVGIYDNTYIQILSGLSASDDVISTWHASLKDGAVIVLPGELESRNAASDAATENTAETTTQDDAEQADATTDSEATDDLLDEGEVEAE